MEKTYILYGIDTAVNILRPGAIWEITNNYFSRWDDPRPCPTMDEVYDVMQKLKDLEDSINIVLLPEQHEEVKEIKKSLNN